MMKSSRIIFLIVAFLFVNQLSANDDNAFQLVKKTFEMWRGETSSITTMTMSVVRPDRTTTMTLQAWAKGDNYSIVKFKSPARYKGQAILVVYDSMWVYSPKSNRSIKIANSLKSQAWMGSDMSYDDISVNLETLKNYTYKRLADETKDNVTAYVIEATPLKNAPIVWGKEVYVIKKSDNSLLRKDFYDQTGKAIKRFIALKVIYYQGDKTRPLMEHMRVYNLEKEGYYTDFIMEDVTLDVKLNKNMFSLSNLAKP